MPRNMDIDILDFDERRRVVRIGINLYSKWPYKEVIQAFLENGINRTFVCVEHPYFDEVMQALAKTDIVVDNLHAPFIGQNNIWKEGETGDKTLQNLCNGIDCCVKYGVNLMVAHVSNGRPMPEITDVGLERFDKLMIYAKAKGVTVAFENHRYLENVKYFMDRYPEAGFCLDTAHEHAFTPGTRYMPIWGERLVATHISDNDCLCDKDMHMLPFDGIIDFDKTAREISECGKNVTLMLEVKPDNHPRYADISITDYYLMATEKLKKFKKMVEI